MKKYLIITLVSGVIITSLIYSFVYVPEFKEFLYRALPRSEKFEESPVPKEDTLPQVVIETLPNLSIKSEDNFKPVRFGDLNLKVSNEYKLSESSERIVLKINDSNEIAGFYYPLTSIPRKDIDVSNFESELLKNTYVLEKKSNIPDEFVKKVFDITIGSTVTDLIGGESITYEVRDLVSSKSPNLAGFFLDSNKENYYKFIILTTKKLYIFNVKNDSNNYTKMKKTFYNLEFN
jgi:hypothetical protein